MKKIQIEGINYLSSAFNGEEEIGFEAKSAFHHRLYHFLKEWYSPSPLLTLHTSGSTGKPKEIAVHKEQMLRSAAVTCDYLGLKTGDTALLCLPLEYIAGKMMVVRALYGGLNLLVSDPSGHPLAEERRQIDFAAMVPLQVYNSLQGKEEKERLTRVGRLIIGGGAIDPQLEEALKDFPNAIYSTYGMTETVSHIALRRISGEEAGAWYTPLPGVQVKLSEEGTLVAHAPRVTDNPVITNDIAEVRENGTFRILGRSDNVIISGGIKIQTEAVEAALRPHIDGPVAFTSVPHPKLGEALVLLITPASAIARAREICSRHLPRLQRPLHILMVEAIPQTGSGKTDRAAAKKMASKRIPMPDIP